MTGGTGTGASRHPEDPWDAALPEESAESEWVGGPAGPAAGRGAGGADQPAARPPAEAPRAESDGSEDPPSLSILDALGDASATQSHRSEESVLGSMILDHDCIGDVIDLLNAEDFSLKRHQIVFETLVELFDRGSGTDVTLVGERLMEKKQFDAAGGELGLFNLVRRVPSSANVMFHAKIVLRKSLLRRLVGAANEILQSARGGGASVEDLVDDAERRIFEVAHRSTQQSSSQSFKETLEELLKAIEVRSEGELEGTPSFYPDLDEKLGGMRGGQMLILAARPSMGKTTFALNVARRVATQSSPSLGVIVFSLEMSKQQLAQHLVCAHAQIESQVLRRGRLTSEDSERLGLACHELADAPIFIDDTPGLTMLQIRAKARRLAARQQIGLIVVDYLQLVTGPKVESRQLEISHISMSMKQLSRELDVPVIAISQLNRSVETRENHRPRMSDLRESGSLEQDADVVMFLHRDEYFDQGKERASHGKAQLIIAKQRNGPVGDIDLTFVPSQLRFEPYSDLDWVG